MFLGVNTTDILTAYISAIRALRVLDTAGVILELVCEPVRRYLRYGWLLNLRAGANKSQKTRNKKQNGLAHLWFFVSVTPKHKKKHCLIRESSF